MKKYFLLLLAFSFISISGYAQKNIRYQGEVEAGYTFGIGNYGYSRINFHMINGIRFNQYSSLGIGVGVDKYNGYSLVSVAIPIFLNVKGYLPVSKKIDLFGSLDGGYSFCVTESTLGGDNPNISGYLMTPAVGASMRMGEKMRINLSVGYSIQNMSNSGAGINNEGVGIKVGFAF